MPALRILEQMPQDDLGHFRQVMELYRSHAFYPKMGAFRNYYTINP